MGEPLRSHAAQRRDPLPDRGRAGDRAEGQDGDRPEEPHLSPRQGRPVMTGAAASSIVFIDPFAAPAGARSFVLAGPPGSGMGRAGQIARDALMNALTGPRKRRRAASRTPVPGSLLTLAQAAAVLGMSQRTLRDHLRDGSIAWIDIGR